MVLLQAETCNFSLWKERKPIRQWKRGVLVQIPVQFHLLLQTRRYGKCQKTNYVTLQGIRISQSNTSILLLQYTYIQGLVYKCIVALRLLMSYIYIYIYVYIWNTYSWCFQITHNDAPQSVGLLWTSDQLVAETSNWQHTTLKTDKYPCPGGIRTQDLSWRAATGPLPAEILGSNPTGGMDICLLWVSCVVR